MASEDLEHGPAEIRPWMATLVVAVLTLAPMSGCLSAGEGSSRIPRPSLGATYHYVTKDEGALALHVGATAERMGPSGLIHEARLLNLTVDNGTREDTFQEALGTDGTIHQHLATCRTPTADQPCANAMVILTAAGLPGGLGAAPFWGASTENLSRPTFRFDAPGHGPANITFNVTETSEPREGCVELEGDVENPELVRAPTYAVVNGPFTLCPGTPFPVRAESVGGTEYILDRSDRITVPTAPPQSLAGPEAPWKPPTTPWQAPFVAQDHTDTFPFPLREAHQEAMNRSDVYRDVIGDGGWVIGSLVRERGHGEYMGERYQTLYQRRLIAATQDGEAADVLLFKRMFGREASREALPSSVQGPGGTQPGAITLEEESSGHIGPAMTGKTVAERQVDAGLALERARALLGDRNVSNIQLVPTYLPHQWSKGWPGVGPHRSDGTTLRLLLEGPTRTDGGFTVRTNYQVVFDGPTGDLLWLTLPREQLPLLPRGSAG